MDVFISLSDILSTREAARISEEVDLGLSLRLLGKNMPESLKIGARVSSATSAEMLGAAGSSVTRCRDFLSLCEVPC